MKKLKMSKGTEITFSKAATGIWRIADRKI